VERAVAPRAETLALWRVVPPGLDCGGMGRALRVARDSNRSEATMSTKEVASGFAELCRAGKFEEAGHKYWSDDVISIEPMTGDMARVQGRKAVEDKGKWWADNHDVHGVKVEGPFVNGDEFTVRFEMEVTPKGKSRTKMTEIALYKVKNNKVVEERFYFGGD
jgi:SnoaL-like domain